MRVINLSENNSLLNQFVAEVRDVKIQKDRLRFRKNLERIGEIMAYEISKTLEYNNKKTKTPLGTAETNVVKNKIVLSTILRAGIPFHTGFLNFYDEAENAFVSAYRKFKDALKFEINIEYIASPDLSKKTLIIVDPMLASGGSFELAHGALLSKGKPSKVILASIIASKQGVDYLQKTMPEDSVLWCAAIDSEMNEHSYIVPGLGDAGDLAFGTKL